MCWHAFQNGASRKATKDKSIKVSGLLNTLNAIEKSKILVKKVRHVIFLGTSTRYAQYESREG